MQNRKIIVIMIHFKFLPRIEESSQSDTSHGCEIFVALLQLELPPGIIYLGAYNEDRYTPCISCYWVTQEDWR